MSRRFLAVFVCGHLSSGGDLLFSPKQIEYLRHANARWNIKSGATRSGKTYLDYFVIPREIRQRRGLPGLTLVLGYTHSTIRRNLLAPMRSLWGDTLVGDMRADGSVSLFGETAYCVGADKVSAADRLRGASVKYCYGDEMTTWNQEVFEMLKSRLDQPYSRFDGTCNPAAPSHWVKGFLDSGAAVFSQSYALSDNPFLHPDVANSLKQEYKGSIYYDRYILGHWKAATGLIYRPFLEDERRALLSQPPPPPPEDAFLSVGVDFGGNRSLTAFVAVMLHSAYRRLDAVLDHHIPGEKGDIDAAVLCRHLTDFLSRLANLYPCVPIRFCFCDNEGQYLINTLRHHLRRPFPQIQVLDCLKVPIHQRIAITNALFSSGRLRVSPQCRRLLAGLREAVWDPAMAHLGKDVRLDNGSTDIDILDAFEYAFSRYLKKLSQPLPPG